MKTQLRQLTIATRGAFTDSGQELSIVRFTQNAHVPYLSPQRLCNGATAYLLGVGMCCCSVTQGGSIPPDKGIGGDTVIESPSFSPSISLMRNVRYRESFSNPQIRNRVGK
ncbi:hypothetical protein L195_g041659 [Trifolium pratense]|uniref:Uncharacterized protein n=1 Tax=Trifolium pratense TaxID=57577 RepID=A0A2K3M483_TRIPR|nr:hypothetical protein L195_g041659 [Trifolium pratense]